MLFCHILLHQDYPGKLCEIDTMERSHTNDGDPNLASLEIDNVPGVTRLPDETIEQIFKIISDELLQETPVYQWWDLPEAHAAFFSSASLVCRRWHQLAQSFMIQVRVPRSACVQASNSYEADGEECQTQTLRSQCQYTAMAKSFHSQTAAPWSANFKHVRSLCIDVRYWNDSQLKPTFHLIGTQAACLRLYGSAGGNDTLDWSSASYIHTNPNLKELSLQGIHIVIDEACASLPCLSQSVVLEAVSFAVEADFSSTFPEASRLVVNLMSHRRLIGEPLQLFRPSSALEHLTLRCETEYWIKLNDQESGKKTVLNSVGLRTCDIEVDAGHRSHDVPDPLCTSAAILPGFDLPNLIKLEMVFKAPATLLVLLVCMLYDFKKPAFCPALRQIPSIKVKTAPGDDISSLQVVLGNLLCEELEIVLQKLEARGLKAEPEELEGTVWAYSKRMLRHGLLQLR